MNSHQRAIERAAKGRSPHGIGSPATENKAKPEESKTENRNRRNLHDDPTFIAYVGLLVAPVFFALQANGIVEITWIPSLLIYVVETACFFYLFRKWQRAQSWSRRKREAIGLLIAAGCVALFGYAVRNQYTRDHVPSPLSFSATVAFAYPDGKKQYGIEWQNRFQDVRLEIANTAKFPIHDLDLTVQLIDPNTATDVRIVGMGQVSDISDVEFHAPDLHFGATYMGADGQRYRFEADDFVKNAFGTNWKMMCRTLPTGPQLRIAVATLNAKNFSLAPKRIEVLGSYAVASDDGNKSYTFEKIVDVVR